MGYLFNELKRRKVFRVIAVYAIISWLIIQIADVVLPTFNAPQWVNQTIILLLTLGLPVAIVLAWAFELTTEGISVENEQGPASVSSIPNKQSINSVVLGFMVLAVCFLLVDRFFLSATQFAPMVNNNSAIDDTQVIRSSLNLGIMDQQIGTRIFSEIAISPDGSKLAYTKSENNNRQLLLRELDQFESSFIAEFPTANGTLMPVFSTDGDKIAITEGVDPIAGELIAYSTTGQRIDSGVGQLLGTGVQWLDESTLVYTSYVDFKFYQTNIDTTSEAPTIIEFEHRGGATQPELLPGGKAALFVESIESVGLVNQGDIYLANLETQESELLFANSFSPRYVPSGHLVFMRGTTLWGVAFDLENLEVIGDEIPLLRDIDSFGIAGQASFSFSKNGRLAYLPATRQIQDDAPTGFSTILFWIDRDGEQSPINLQDMSLHPSSVSRLSPDSRQIAITSWEVDGSQDVWVYDVERSVLSRRSFNTGSDPFWSTDNETLYYLNGSRVQARASNGVGDPVSLFDGVLGDITASPDNSSIFYIRNRSVEAGGGSDIYRANLNDIDTFESSELILETSFNTRWPSLSPDGSWIVYGSDESGIFEVYVRPYPNLDEGRWQISTRGGAFPKWGRDGSELFYTDKQPFDVSGSEGSMMAVSVNLIPEFEVGPPTTLFKYPDPVPHSGFDVTADGATFLIPRLTVIENDRKPVSVVLVENWFSELRRLLPGN